MIEKQATSKKLLASMGLFLLVGVIFACSSPVTPPPATSSNGATSSPTATDAASVMFGKVQSALGSLAAQSPKPSQEQVRTALQALTTVPADVEVAISKTPTGLDVDAIQGSVKVEKSCVIGQVRAGQVSMTTQPVLTTGLCFVGDQR